MKKIKKVWPAYLKTNPDGDEVKKARKYIAEPYKDFHDAYQHGIAMFKYEDWKADWLIDLLNCTLWDLFEDIHEPTEEDYRKMNERARLVIDKLPESDETVLVSGPDRYMGKSGMQVFDIINDFGMDFYEGNVLKYLIRYKKKNGLDDLKKCRDYLDYMIARYMD
ncbi:DUF3310 domain-containing protein [Fructobacillus sp. M158]|uniref:DUF3310 domain-containing protein n=1 Tax=Fructobacillus parabroussonetiae TaxID=2713174 RepID=UPI00200B6B68|nr:DUF3310 domain-containing protein [Fructobacillus parabroussonetiae]MCK8617539.1 DUF3310 domain-containing protein [Fructobacillus parabroussonetiae]